MRARVAVQVEGLKKGLQTTEDRILVVKATSPEDAIERLEPEWKAYAEPYVAVGGRRVRWQLDQVVSIFELIDQRIDPRGTEVYSKLGQRRMRPEYEWHPSRTRSAASQTASRGRRKSR